MFDNLPFPSLFVCFLIFILWLHYEKRKSSREEKRRSDEFWQREEAANCARNKDISKLPMFEPDMKQIPMPESSDENICYYQNRVIEQSKLPMMDLSEYSNTDLKLAYGVGNFKTLSQYDENFNDFLMNMSNLGKSYHKGELLEEAAAVYRCCLNSGSDKSTDYRALAEIYAAMGARRELSSLAEEVLRSELPRREILSQELRKLV